MTAAEAALLVVDSVSGVEVQTEVVWDFAVEYEVPRFIVINKLDRDNGSFARALESCQKAFGRVKVVPIQIPLGKERDFKGVVDLIKNKAFCICLGWQRKC